MKTKNLIAIISALMAAMLYSISIPFSKLIENEASPVFLASLFYFGAGIGVAIISLFKKKNNKICSKIVKNDVIYIILMVVLDIIAPILMMYGIKIGSASSASLLNNFEIVATSLLAFLIFKEKISIKLIIGIILILISSILLSFDFSNKIQLSIGSLFVLLATICWGLENNCTRQLSNKNTYHVVTIKGLSCGTGSLIIAILKNDPIPKLSIIALILVIGFISYGLSIFLYIRAQNIIGAAKTSAFYAINPFIGSLLGLIVLNESISSSYLISLIVMVIGSLFVVLDTLKAESSTT